MSEPCVEVLGTLTSDGTLFLDEAPDLPAGRVRVSLRAEVVAVDGVNILIRHEAGPLAVPAGGEEVAPREGGRGLGEAA